MKKVQKLILTMVLILGLGLESAIGVFADIPTTSTEDILAPTLNNITFDKDNVNAPGTVEVTIDASDNLSGIDRCSLTIRNTDSGASYLFLCYLYYQDDTGRHEYSDGKLHGKIELGQYASAGDYYVANLMLTDKAGNDSQWLYGKGYESYDMYVASYPEQLLPSQFAEKKITVINSNNSDCTAPTLVDISFDKQTVSTPDTVEITIDTYDELSGIESGSLGIRNIVTGASHVILCYTYYQDDTGQHEYSDGKLHGKVEFGQYASAGDYYVANLQLTDKAQNNTEWRYGKGFESYDYYVDTFPNQLLPDEFADKKITVINSDNMGDYQAPTLLNIVFSKQVVETPGTVEVTIDAVDDLSGLESGSIAIRNVATGSSHIFFCYRYYQDNMGYHEYTDGKLHGKVDFNQYAASGDYYVQNLQLIDKAKNSSQFLYGKGFESYDDYVLNKPDQLLPVRFAEMKVAVVNTGKTPDIVTSTTSANFISEIANVVDDGNIVADFSNNPDISSDVFTTIAGTNKEVTFTSSGISWQFNGADVDPSAAKNINLAVDIKTTEQDTTAVGESIKELAGEEVPALILHFADNGQLPGKATIRVKADYALRNYLGYAGLDVYFWDSTNNALVPIASNVSIDNNGDIMFDITHCSYYVIVGKTDGSVPAIYDPSVAFIECDGENYSENYIDNLLYQLEEIAEEGTVQTIIWNQGTALPEGVMSFLKDHPKITLIFNYSYEGKEYSVTIPGSKAIVDPEIPWYGPMWLYAHYSGNVVANNGTVAKSGVYIVQAGDTLNKIAQSKGVTLEHIKSLNPSITNVNRIFIGQSINY